MLKQERYTQLLSLDYFRFIYRRHLFPVSRRTCHQVTSASWLMGMDSSLLCFADPNITNKKLIIGNILYSHAWRHHIYKLLI